MSAIEDKAMELITEAVRKDSVLMIYYPLSGMEVGIPNSDSSWSSEGSTRAEVEMEDALRQMQAKGLIERGFFGRALGSRGTRLRPTVHAFRRLSD